MSSGYWVLMAFSQPAFVVTQHAILGFSGLLFRTKTHIITPKSTNKHPPTPPKEFWQTQPDIIAHYYLFICLFFIDLALCEKHIDKYLEYLPAETLKLNWAELRQMRCSKLNKQSSLLGDSTMVIRVSCELPYIIYGCAVGCLQLNRPTVHWLGILWEADSKRGGGVKNGFISSRGGPFSSQWRWKPQACCFQALCV